MFPPYQDGKRWLHPHAGWLALCSTLAGSRHTCMCATFQANPGVHGLQWARGVEWFYAFSVFSIVSISNTSKVGNALDRESSRRTAEMSDMHPMEQPGGIMMVMAAKLTTSTMFLRSVENCPCH